MSSQILQRTSAIGCSELFILKKSCCATSKPLDTRHFLEWKWRAIITCLIVKVQVNSIMIAIKEVLTNAVDASCNYGFPNTGLVTEDIRPFCVVVSKIIIGKCIRFQAKVTLTCFLLKGGVILDVNLVKTVNWFLDVDCLLQQYCQYITDIVYVKMASSVKSADFHFYSTVLRHYWFCMVRRYKLYQYWIIFS